MIPPKTEKTEVECQAREKLRKRRLSELVVPVPPKPLGHLILDYKSASPGRSAPLILSQFCEEWLKVVDRDDKESLALFLCYNLVSYFELNNTQETKIAAKKVNKSDRTVKYCRTDLIKNDDIFQSQIKGSIKGLEFFGTMKI